MKGKKEQNYYEFFGLDSKATDEEINRAYRKKIRKLHPDKIGDHNDDKAKFCNAARDVLLDPIQRANYDKANQKEKIPTNPIIYVPWLADKLINLPEDEARHFFEEMKDKTPAECFRYPLEISDFFYYLPEIHYDQIATLFKNTLISKSEYRGGEIIYDIIASLSEDKRVKVISELGPESFLQITKRGNNYDLASEVPLPSCFPPNSDIQKAIKKFHSPSLPKRVASAFDLIPPLALFVPIIGWLYLIAWVVNKFNSLTNQRYSFWKNYNPGYTEKGLDWNFHPVFGG